MIFGKNQYEYEVKVCPCDEPEMLEDLLNEMSEQDWELYMLHEVDSKDGDVNYNCIFYREIDESLKSENNEIIDVSDFKSRMEKSLSPFNSPYDQCKDVQRNISLIKSEIKKIKNLLDSPSSDSEHEELNEKLSKKLEELEDLKEEFSLILEPELMYDRVNQPKITIVISDELLSLIDNEKNGELISESVKLRQSLTDELGYVIPSVKFTNQDTLSENEYRIDIRGINAYSGAVYPDYEMFYEGQVNIDEYSEDTIKDFDEFLNKNTIWIPCSQTKSFWEKGKTAAEVIIENLKHIVCKYVDDILDYKDINNYMELVIEQNPYLIQNLIPNIISVGNIRYILSKLIKESVSVKDITFIFEKLNDISEVTMNRDIIVKDLRKSLSKQICNSISDSDGNIYAILLSQDTADFIDQFIQKQDKDEEYEEKSHDTKKFNKYVNKISGVIDNTGIDYNHIILLVPDALRDKLYRLNDDINRQLRVLSKEELSNEFNVEIIETI